MDKYIAGVYKKIKIGENKYVFKYLGTAFNASIDFTSDFRELYFNDDNGNQIKLYDMKSAEFMISDINICYGFPKTMDEVLANYPDNVTEEEIVSDYEREHIDNLLFGYYSESDDNVKICKTTINELDEKFNNEDTTRGFTLSYNSDWEVIVGFTLNEVKRLIKCAASNDDDKVKKELLKLKGIMEHKYAVPLSVYESTSLKQIAKRELVKQEELNKSLDKLNSLIGLKDVKYTVDTLLKYLLFKKKVQDKLKLDNLSLHMIYTGNPGTGKTTVARIISKLLYDMGYIKNNNVAEITPKDLIAGYVGQTALKTAKFLEKNRGGVIFIDEAYVFSNNAQHFAEEALAEVLKELEKNETVFIFAGYKKEMEDFIKMNSGLESRIGFYFDFQDYSLEELYEIFESKVQEIGFTIDNSLKSDVLSNLMNAKSTENFGNGRYVDKLINKLILSHARNMEDSNNLEELTILKKEDLDEKLEKSLHAKIKVKHIGF
ncbi:MAG: AAA family ATPase [Bacilli bacterium]|nr:AAA family ATPase [Bacilli bacterium]